MKYRDSFSGLDTMHSTIFDVCSHICLIKPALIPYLCCIITQKQRQFDLPHWKIDFFEID